MNPSSAISHSTLHTLESLDRKSPRSTSVIVAIASAAILILTGFILLVTCSSPVAYGLGGIFVLAAGAIIATALIAKLILCIFDFYYLVCLVKSFLLIHFLMPD